MRIFDFNMHFTKLGPVENPHMFSDETQMGYKDLTASFGEQIDIFKENVTAANFMIFNQNLFMQEKDLSPFFKQVGQSLPGSCFTALFDFRRPDISKIFNEAADQGVSGLKFHSYFQKIAETDYTAALAIARQAEKRGMFICIDTSFGTSGMYRYDNMKFACAVADEVSCPVVLLHSGGLRALEAMLLAQEKSHVYLETSFSLHFYKESTIEKDILFAYKKLGPGKLLYASDYPYVGFGESFSTAAGGFKRCGFSDKNMADIFYYNAQKLIQNAQRMIQ